MTYRDAFNALCEPVIPRRKYAPEHWLTEVYFFGSRVGYRLSRLIRRSPLTIWWRGVVDGWREFE